MYILKNHSSVNCSGSKDEYFLDIDNGEYYFSASHFGSKFNLRRVTMATYTAKSLKITCTDGKRYGNVFNFKFYYWGKLFSNSGSPDWWECYITKKHIPLIAKYCMKLGRYYIENKGEL